MKWMMVCVAFVALAAARKPTTNPASRPTFSDDPAVAGAEAKLQTAIAGVNAARDECLKRLALDPAYQQAKSEVEQTRAVLATARSSGTPEEKLTASGAFNKSRMRVEQFEKDALRADEGMKSATSAVDQARVDVENARGEASRLADERRAAADAKAKADELAKDKDPIQHGIRIHKLVIGMTYDQAVAAMGWKGELIRDAADYKEYRWQKFEDVPTVVDNRHSRTFVRGPAIFGDFEAGKLSRIVKP